MSRLEDAFGRSDAEQLATLHEKREEEVGRLSARLSDPRLAHPSRPSLDYDVDRNRRRGPDRLDLGR